MTDARHAWIADGSHAGLRWYVERMADAVHPVVTVNGWDGATYITETREMANATPELVRAWIDELAAARTAKAARKARR